MNSDEAYPLNDQPRYRGRAIPGRFRQRRHVECRWYLSKAPYGGEFRLPPVTPDPFNDLANLERFDPRQLAHLDEIPAVGGQPASRVIDLGLLGVQGWGCTGIRDSLPDNGSPQGFAGDRVKVFHDRI